MEHGNTGTLGEACGGICVDSARSEVVTAEVSAPGAWHPECASHSPAAPLFKIATKHGGARPGSGPKPKVREVAPAAPPVQVGPRWYCLQVPAGRELWAILEALTVGCEALLPLCQMAKDAVWEPAFPGFVFVRFDHADFGWRLMLAEDRGWRLLGADNEHPTMVPDAEIARLRAYGPEGDKGQWVPPSAREALAVGSRVTVADGPFTNFPGTVIEERGGRVRVAVEIFGRLTECDLSRWAVERV